jgi:cell division protein FtsQ
MKAAPALRTRILPAAAAVAVIAALAGGGWYGWRELSARPIAHVGFGGDLARIAPADLEAFAKTLRGAPAASASLASVREAARAIPWVRDASVRRRFPDGIEVRFQTHEPLARWGKGALVSTRGEVFTAPYDGKLPRFAGPDGSAPQMAEEYAALSRIAAPLASPVAELHLSARGAWQLFLDSGLSLELGRGDIRARLERFVAAWPGLAARGVRTVHADLRYANGFALRRAAEPNLPAKKK